MNTTAMVDSEKKAWTQPVLGRLEVKKTASKENCQDGDKQYPGPEACNHS